jgi:hypothetical protein
VSRFSCSRPVSAGEHKSAQDVRQVSAGHRAVSRWPLRTGNTGGHEGRGVRAVCLGTMSTTTLTPGTRQEGRARPVAPL